MPKNPPDLPQLLASSVASDRVQVQETAFSHDLLGRYICNDWSEVEAQIQIQPRAWRNTAKPHLARFDDGSEAEQTVPHGATIPRRHHRGGSGGRRGSPVHQQRSGC